MLEVGVMPETGGAQLMESRGFGKSTIDLGRFCLFLDPLPEAPPTANEAFMGNVDHGIGTEDHVRGRHQERAPRPAEILDDPDNVGDRRISHVGKHCHRSRAARLAVVRSLFREGLEHATSDRAKAIAG
jgi:hypothetical protein